MLFFAREFSGCTFTSRVAGILCGLVATLHYENNRFGSPIGNYFLKTDISPKIGVWVMLGR